MGRMKPGSVGLFFLLAYLLPWMVWFAAIAHSAGVLAFRVPNAFAFWFGLTIATYGVAFLSGGMPAVKDLLARLIRTRINPVWFAVAVLLVPALAAIAVGIALLAGVGHTVPSDVTFGRVAGALLFQWFFFLLTEETAWRGFALPRLQSRMPALAANLLLGVLWGLWHLPLFFIPGSFQSHIPFSGFILSAVATSVLTGWIFNNARGSVLVVALFHAATDTTIAFSAVMSARTELFWIFVSALAFAAIVVVLIARPGRLAGNRDISEAVIAV